MPENSAADIERVESLWRACGARVARMDAILHDQIFAAVSHLPHLLAFAVMDELMASRPLVDMYFRYAGAGLRDATRIAGSHPEMWRDITLANRDALLEELDALGEKLKSLRALVGGEGRRRIGACLFACASGARRLRSRQVQQRLTDLAPVVFYRSSFMEFIDLPALSGARGKVRLPGSKSISNRMLLLAAFAGRGRHARKRTARLR